MIAAGTYLKTLREAHGISRAEAAAQTGTNEVQIFRIEKGEIDTRGSMLMALIKAVRGSADQLAELILDTNATAEDGQQLASRWLTNREIATIDAMDSGELEEFISLLDEIRQKDDAALATIRRMLRGFVGK